MVKKAAKATVKKPKKIPEERGAKTRVVLMGRSPKKKVEYIRTGIPGLDNLLPDGVPVNSSILISGGAGSGKTLLCLQMLYNAVREGKKCFYMSFEESEGKLKGHMEKFGWNLKGHEENFVIKRFNLFDIMRSIDALLAKQSGDLLIDVKPVLLPDGFKPDIIVVDSMTAIASAFSEKGETYRLYIEQLFRFFEQQEVNTYLISETEQEPRIFSPTGVEEFLADGVIVLHNIRRGNVRESGLEILKMRGAKHEKKIVAMQIIEDKGIEVYPDQEVFGMEQKIQ